MTITRTDLVIPVYEHPAGFTARVRGDRVQITYSDIEGTTTLDVPVGALDVLCELGMQVRADQPEPEPDHEPEPEVEPEP